MTLVKVCGIRTAEEGRVALEAGADWLGFVFWEHSKRYVDTAAARDVVRTLRSGKDSFTAVGVFVDPTADEAARIADEVGLDYLQLSGHEDVALIRQMSRPVIKAVHVGRGEEHEAAAIVSENRLEVPMYLLDTKVEGRYGGTGAAFDWEALRSIGSTCLVAGGLKPDNVSSAIRTLQPRGVDVSGGVEYPGGGKDPALVHAFLRAVRSADGHQEQQ